MTVGKKILEEYGNGDKVWNSISEKEPDSNLNRASREPPEDMLRSELYGTARNICRLISDTTIPCDDGRKRLADASRKGEALSVLSEVYQTAITLLATTYGTKDTEQNFESCFNSQVFKLSSDFSSSKHPEPLKKYLLLASPAAENGQRTSVVAAA